METPVITFDDWYLYIDVHISGQTYIGPCFGEQTLLKSELSVGLRVFPVKAWRSIYICHQHLWSGCWPVAVMGPEQGTRTSTGFCRGFTTWTVVQLDLLGIPKLVFLAAKPGLRPKHRQWQKGWDSARCLLWSQFGVNLAVDLNAEKFGASMTNRKLCLIKHQDFNLHPCSKSTHPMEKNQAGNFRLEVVTQRENRCEWVVDQRYHVKPVKFPKHYPGCFSSALRSFPPLVVTQTMGRATCFIPLLCHASTLVLGPFVSTGEPWELFDGVTGICHLCYLSWFPAEISGEWALLVEYPRMGAAVTFSGVHSTTLRVPSWWQGLVQPCGIQAKHPDAFMVSVLCYYLLGLASLWPPRIHKHVSKLPHAWNLNT